jgi:hypothetical protein
VRCERRSRNRAEGVCLLHHLVHAAIEDMSLSLNLHTYRRMARCTHRRAGHAPYSKKGLFVCLAINRGGIRSTAMKGRQSAYRRGIEDLCCAVWQ